MTDGVRTLAYQIAARHGMKLGPSVIDALITQAETYGDDAILILTAPIGQAQPGEATILWCNLGFEAMTGYPREEVVGRTPVFLRGPGTDAAAVNRIRVNRNANRPARSRFLNYRKDGSPFWVDVIILPVLPTASTEQGVWISIQRDVTEEMAREQALAEAQRAESLLAQVVETVTSQIHVFDAETLRYVRANAPARLALGLAPTALSAASPTRYWSGFDETTLRERIAPLISGALREAAFLVLQLGGDGRPRPYAARLTLLRHGEQGLIVAVLDDLSERQTAQKLLEDSETRYRLAVEASADGIWDRPWPGDVIHFSDRNRQMLGYSAEEFPDHADSWRSYVHPDDRARVAGSLRRCVEEGGAFDETYRMRRKDGALVWWRSRAAVWRDGAGAPVRVLGVNSDVTELVEARRAAEEAARLKAEFLAKLSHEVRTPLNGILGMTELMRLGEHDAARATQLDIVASSGRSLLAIIEDVLTLARIEAGLGFGRSETFRLRDLCDEALDPIRAVALGKSVALENAAPASWWSGDARSIRLVLINLVGNAAKFTGSGVVRLSARPEGDALRFEVADSGPGVPQSLRAVIFEPFRQGDDSPTRAFGGLGLGLAIARETVRRIGGSIDVGVSEFGGAAFWFTVPAHPADAPTADDGPESPRSVPSRRHPSPPERTAAT